jgi:predicted outer membrane repeat protein
MFYGCLFQENVAQGSGGALYLGGSSFSSGKALLGNCTVSLNTGAAGGGGIFAQTTTTVPAVGWMRNSIVFYNRGAVAQDIAGTLQVWDSIAPGQSGPGVLALNPRFENVRLKNLALRSDSPGLDIGNLAWLPQDALDVDEDGIFAELLPVDLLGTTRVLGPGIDMGAFERP